MSQEAIAPKADMEVEQPQLTIIGQYYQILSELKVQRDNAQKQFEQAIGAIFACETFIRIYEDSAKQAAMAMAKKVADDAASKKKIENIGGSNDDKANYKRAKKVAPK